MADNVIQQIAWEFVGNDGPLNAAIRKAESSAQTHVNVVNSHFKNMGKGINVNEHFVSSTRKVEKEAEAHVSKVNSIFKKMGSTIKESVGGVVGGALSVFGGGALMGAVQGAEQAVEKIADIGLQFAETWEKAEVRMAAFTGDAKDATRTLQALQDIAVDRALEFKPLSEAAFKLTEIGIKGPQLVSMFKGITAEAIALGRGSEGVSRLVGMLEMMEDSGKAAGRGLIQLERQGYQIGATLEKVTGMSRQFLMKALQAGKLDAKLVIGTILPEAWEEQWGALAPKFQQTFNDQLTRTTQQAGPILATAMGPLIDGATHVMLNLQATMAKFGPTVAEGIATGISPIVGTMTRMLDGLLMLLHIKLEEGIDKTQEDSKKLQNAIGGAFTTPKIQAHQGTQFLQSPKSRYVSGDQSQSSDLLKQLESAIQDPNFKAFVKALSSKGFEGSTYTTAYGKEEGSLDLSKGLAGVPRVPITSGPNKGKTTSAFGEGQFEISTYKQWATEAGLNPNDISAHAQDLVLAYGLKKLKALDQILEGKFAEAITQHNLKATWTSLPSGIESHSNTIGQFIRNSGGPPNMQQQVQGVGSLRRFGGGDESTEASLNEYQRLLKKSNEKLSDLANLYEQQTQRIPVLISQSDSMIKQNASRPDLNAYGQVTRAQELIAGELKDIESYRELIKLEQSVEIKHHDVLMENIKSLTNLSIGNRLYKGFQNIISGTPIIDPKQAVVEPPKPAAGSLQPYFDKILADKRQRELIADLQRAKAGPRPSAPPVSFTSSFQQGVEDRAAKLERPGQINQQWMQYQIAITQLAKTSGDLNKTQQAAIQTALKTGVISEEQKKTITALVMADNDFTKAQKAATLKLLEHTNLTDAEMKVIQKAMAGLIFKYEPVGNIIKKGLTQQAAEGPQQIRDSSAKAVSDFPKAIGGEFTKFLTTWNGTWKSAREMLVGGLKSAVVAPIAGIIGQYVSQWIATEMLKLGIEKIFHVSKQVSDIALMTSVDANTVALGVNSFMLGVNAAVPLAGGGFISGPGGPRSDSIPAFLSNGEYVVQASAVNKYGTNFLDNLNKGHAFARYADGGYNSAMAPIFMPLSRTQNGGRGGGDTHVSITLNAPVQGGTSHATAASRREYLEAMAPGVEESIRNALRGIA